MKRGAKKGGRGVGEKRQCEGEQGAPVSLVSTRSAECGGELCVAMQIYCPVCLAVPSAEDGNTRDRRERDRVCVCGGDSDRMEMRERGKERK